MTCNVLIYGAGNNGVRLFNLMSDKNVIGFIDNYKTGSINNIQIFNLQTASETFDTNTPIYISVFNYKNNLNDIVNDLHKVGFNNILTIYDYQKDYYMPAFWFNHNYKIPKEQYLQVRNLLSDNESKEILDNYVNFYEKFDYNTYKFEKSKDFENMYDMPNEFISKIYELNKINYVDCGTCNGDTVVALLHKLSSDRAINSLCCFEPLESNCKILFSIIKENKNRIINTVIFPQGVHKRNDILYFSSNATDAMGGSISENGGDIAIPVVSLDGTIYHTEPNYIKMDIEGSEINAIKGAENIIRDYSPLLKISIYHKPSDIFEIPLLIKQINKDYKNFILRATCENFFDTELFVF